MTDIEIIEQVGGWKFVLNGTVPLILCFVSNVYPVDDDTLDAIRNGLRDHVNHARKHRMVELLGRILRANDLPAGATLGEARLCKNFADQIRELLAKV